MADMEGAGSMSNKALLNMVRDALEKLDGASRTVADIEAATPSDDAWGAAICVRSALANAVRELNAYRKSLEREEENRRRRFESVPILQALLRFSDGTTRRVAVSKPTGAIDEPYVGEMFHAALVRQGRSRLARRLSHPRR